MRTVNIIEFNAPDPEEIRTVKKRKYRVFLGNNLRVEFDNKRQVTTYLNELSRELTTILYAVNEHYGRAWVAYRQIWPYLYYSTKTVKKRAYINAIESSCKHSLNTVDKALEMAHRRSSWQNGNVFTWNHLSKSLQALKVVHESVAEFYKVRSLSAHATESFVEIRRLDNLLAHLEAIGRGDQLLDKKHASPITILKVSV